MRPQLTAIALAGLLSSACGDSTGPTPMQSNLAIASPSPASGSTIHVTVGAPPGLFIPRGSGQLSVPITVTSAREVPWAQLNVYLMTGSDPQSYCGQNMPDSPTWGPFEKGQTVSVTITGFQVFRLPCDVTEIRAYLHTRNNGLGIPPTTSETVANGSMTVSYHLQP